MLPGVGFLFAGGVGGAVAEVHGELAQAGGADDVVEDGGGFAIGLGGEGEAVEVEEGGVVLFCGLGWKRDLDGAAIDELAEGFFVGAGEDFFFEELGADEDEAAAGDIGDLTEEFAALDGGVGAGGEECLVEFVDDEEAGTGGEDLIDFLALLELGLGAGGDTAGAGDVGDEEGEGCAGGEAHNEGAAVVVVALVFEDALGFADAHLAPEDGDVAKGAGFVEDGEHATGEGGVDEVGVVCALGEVFAGFAEFGDDGGTIGLIDAAEDAGEDGGGDAGDLGEFAEGPAAFFGGEEPEAQGFVILVGVGVEEGELEVVGGDAEGAGGLGIWIGV